MVKVAPALERIADFRAFLGEDFDEAFTYAGSRQAETIGSRLDRVNGWSIWKVGQDLRCCPASAGRSRGVIRDLRMCHRN